MPSFLTVTSTRNPPVHTRRRGGSASRRRVRPPGGDHRAALDTRRSVRRTETFAGASARQRRLRADDSRALSPLRRWRIRPDHGRILTICLKAMGLRAGPSLWGADRLRRSPIEVWSSESFAEVVDKLGIIDCGRFAAKSSDNYATWSGKRRLNPSL